MIDITVNNIVKGFEMIERKEAYKIVFEFSQNR